MVNEIENHLRNLTECEWIEIVEIVNESGHQNFMVHREFEEYRLVRGHENTAHHTVTSDDLNITLNAKRRERGDRIERIESILDGGHALNRRI